MDERRLAKAKRAKNKVFLFSLYFRLPNENRFTVREETIFHTDTFQVCLLSLFSFFFFFYLQSREKWEIHVRFLVFAASDVGSLDKLSAEQGGEEIRVQR